MSVKDVGEINSTVLHNDNLASITRVLMNSAGVTAIAEGAFGSFQRLTSLILEQNLLTDINPKWLGRPTILRELGLSGNHIKVLSADMLSGLTRLNKLNLSRNLIRTINPHAFTNLTFLDELDLSENNLTHLTPQVFSPLCSTNMSLHGNPWDCSCAALDFIEFMKGELIV